MDAINVMDMVRRRIRTIPSIHALFEVILSSFQFSKIVVVVVVVVADQLVMVLVTVLICSLSLLAVILMICLV